MKADTLNKKILTIIERHSMNLTEDNTVIDDFSYEDLSKSIQGLILSEKIDLLNECNVICGSSYISDKISELTKQLTP